MSAGENEPATAASAVEAVFLVVENYRVAHGYDPARVHVGADVWAELKRTVPAMCGRASPARMGLRMAGVLVRVSSYLRPDIVIAIPDGPMSISEPRSARVASPIPIEPACPVEVRAAQEAERWRDGEAGVGCEVRERKGGA